MKVKHVLVSLKKAACSVEAGAGCILCFMQHLGRLEYKIQQLHSPVQDASARTASCISAAVGHCGMT